MTRALAILFPLFLAAAPATSQATFYELSGTFTTVGAYDVVGVDNFVQSGRVQIGGIIETDSDAPGYSVLGGDVTWVGEFDVIVTGFEVSLDFNLGDGEASDDGVVFHSGEVCVSFTPASDCSLGIFTVGPGGFFTSLDFTSNATFLGGPIAGVQLTGGAGGASFTVAQPGGVTPVLGNDPADWALAVGFFSVLGFDTGIFLEGDLAFTETEPPPLTNLLVIQLDDVSVDSFNTLLDGGWLPNISTYLVDAGVTFDNSFVSSPQDTPSRATLLRGQYAHNHGAFSDQTPRPLEGGITWAGWLPDTGAAGREDSTIATWLQDEGYRTGFIGKYLTGYGIDAPPGVADPTTYIPAGWDSWQGLIGRSANRMYDYYINNNGAFQYYGNSETEYQTDVLAGQAADFVAAADEAPFFLLVAPGAAGIEILDEVAFVTGNDPLAPLALGIRPAARHLHLADGDAGNGEVPALVPGPAFNPADLAGKPACPRALPPVAPALVSDPSCVADAPLLSAPDVALLSDQYRATLASLIAVDDLVGEVFAALLAAGKVDNTAVILTADNGRMFGEHRQFGDRLAYEESIRVPLVIRIPGGRAGVSDDAMVVNTDIAPTLAALAAVEPPFETDGASLLPLLEQAPLEAWPNRQHMLVEHWFVPSLLKFNAPTYLAWRGMMDGGPDFTYIATRAAPQDFDIEVTFREFYDHASDPEQLHNVALPAETADFFDLLLRVFEGCAGAGCRDIEVP